MGVETVGSLIDELSKYKRSRKVRLTCGMAQADELVILSIYPTKGTLWFDLAFDAGELELDSSPTAPLCK